MSAAWGPDAGAAGSDHPDDFDLPEPPADATADVPDDERPIDDRPVDRTSPLDEPLDVPEADALEQREVVAFDEDERDD